MDAVMDKANETYNFYLYTLTFSDPRVKDWLFMESPLLTLVITALYLVMIRAGPKMMENQKPMELKNSMILYNFACVLLSGYIVIEIRE
eukprot:XP_011668673.1 PREDICTED: elongation of very long chain fatty acids protein 7-like [Strongylocentrotus purpuratus]